MLHSEVTSILSSILMLVLVLVLYSFGEFRSISFAFAHLLIKWPTTLQVPAAAVASCCCELLLLLLLLLSLSQLLSFGFWNCLAKACGNIAMTVLVVAGSAGDIRWPGFAARQVQVCFKF